jgi:hypothetical protein
MRSDGSGPCNPIEGDFSLAHRTGGTWKWTGGHIGGGAMSSDCLSGLAGTGVPVAVQNDFCVVQWP